MEHNTNQKELRVREFFSRTLVVLVLMCGLVFVAFCSSPDRDESQVAPNPMDSRLVVNIKVKELLSNVSQDKEDAWFKIAEHRRYIEIQSKNRDRFMREMGMVSQGDSLPIKVSIPGMKWDGGKSPSLELPCKKGVVSMPVWLLVKWIDQGYINASTINYN